MNRILTENPRRPIKKARTGSTNIVVEADNTLSLETYQGIKTPVVPNIGINTVLTAKVSVPSSGITSLNSIPAPGAGKIIVPVEAFMYLHNQSARFSANTTVYVINNTVSTPVYSGDVSDTVTVPGSLRTFNKFSTSANTTNLYSNQPLNLWAPFGSPVGGAATLDVYVSYKIVSL